MPAYLKIEGVKGEATAKGYEGQLELQSVSFGGFNQIDKTSKGWSGGRVDIGDIQISKMYDSASPLFFQKMCSGKHYPKAIISITKQSTDEKTANETFLLITLEGVYIGNVSYGSGGDRPSESVALVYKKITMKYMTQDATGKLNAEAPEVSWDLETNVG